MMKPALTAEEWADKRHYAESGTGEMVVNMGKWDGTPYMRHSRLPGPSGSPDRHAAAALCLHNQPFGFTREDVELLQEAVIMERGFCDGLPWSNDRKTEMLVDVADRIGALLLPEEEK